MDFEENLKNILNKCGKKETIRKSFADLDLHAKQNFGEFLSGLMRIFCDEENKEKMRASAAEEICRHLNSPSTFIFRRIQIDKWELTQSPTKEEIKEKLVNMLLKSKLDSQLDRVVAAVVKIDGSQLKFVIDIFKAVMLRAKDERANVPGLIDLFGILGRIIPDVAKHLNSDGEHQIGLCTDLAALFEIGTSFVEGLGIVNRLDELHKLTITTFSQLITKIEALHLVALRKFSKQIAKCVVDKLIPKCPTESVCIEAFNLVMNILLMQKKMEDFKIEMISFWEDLLVNGLVTQITIISAKCIGMDRAKNVIESFYEMLDSIEEN